MVGVTVIPLENKEKMKTDQRCCQAKEFQVGQTKEAVQPTEVGNTKIVGLTPLMHQFFWLSWVVDEIHWLIFICFN